MSIAYEMLLVLVLILANGFLSMAEMAVVSSRPTRLQALAQGGSKGAQTALNLSQNSGRFLSTVQVGITLVGVLTGAFSGATIAERMADWLEAGGLSAIAAESVSFAIVVVIITYVTLILGELVPKQIALADSEQVASRVARPMIVIGYIMRPIVAVLDFSSRFVLAITGQKGAAEPEVSEQELRLLIAEAESAGIVEPAERRMMSSVMALGERPVSGVMTPRPEVVWLDIAADEKDALRIIRDTAHSRIVAAISDTNHIAGVIYAKNVLDSFIDGTKLNLSGLVEEAPFVHEHMTVLDVFRVMKEKSSQLLLVIDEYGVFVGVVTKMDILDAIARDFADQEGPVCREILQRDDGSWLLDGAVAIDEMVEKLGLALPADRKYHTAAGFILFELKRVPKLADTCRYEGWIFEVIDMDDRKIDKLLVRRAPPS